MLLSRRAFLGGGVSVAVFPARADEGEIRLEAAPLANGLGYNGASPGPILRAAVGKPIRLRFVNKLDAPTSLALPGAANAVSGFSGLTGPALAPGERRDIVTTFGSPGFHLYLPYGPAADAGQQAAGLFGALVIDEPSPPPVDLDAIVVFSGALRANAAPAPLTLKAPPGARVRLRLANASPDLVMMLTASDAGARIVAIDGRPCEIFAPRGGAFPLAPGARFELMFDMPNERFALALRGAGAAVQIDPEGEPARVRGPIVALPGDARLPREIALERAQQVRVTVSGAAEPGFALNGVGDADWPAKPLFKAARGTPVSLTLVNQTSAPQTLRLEGHVARQLHALDDGWDPYWRDTFLIAPGKTLHAAFVADAPGKWPLASASPERRAKGMAGWFEVT